MYHSLERGSILWKSMSEANYFIGQRGRVFPVYSHEQTQLLV